MNIVALGLILTPESDVNGVGQNAHDGNAHGGAGTLKAPKGRGQRENARR